MATIILKSLADTEALAHALGLALAANGWPPLLLTGPLGCGKTTLTASIVNALPGGEQAEPSSPSFTIYNIYPTKPQVLHCDLFRCKENIPEEALDMLDSHSYQVIIEWAEYLKQPLPEFLDIYFKLDNNARQLEFNAKGATAVKIKTEILSFWQRRQSF